MAIELGKSLEDSVFVRLSDEERRSRVDTLHSAELAAEMALARRDSAARREGDATLDLELELELERNQDARGADRMVMPELRAMHEECRSLRDVTAELQVRRRLATPARMRVRLAGGLAHFALAIPVYRVLEMTVLVLPCPAQMREKLMMEQQYMLSIMQELRDSKARLIPTPLWTSSHYRSSPHTPTPMKYR